MKKIFSIFAVLFVCLISFGLCTKIKPEVGQEAVVTDYPWIFGEGGTRECTYKPGLQYTWLSVSVKYFNVTPVQYNENFDDIFSNNNTPLDFHSYIRIQIKEGEAWKLYKNYGENWYKNNIQVDYRNYTREEVSKYSPFDLVSNREVLARIDSVVMKRMIKHVEKLSSQKEMPIVICSIVTGAASPNKEQLTEMNRTAALIQKKESEQRNKEMELTRAEAERARAIADKAYMESMNLSADQFIQLKYIEMVTNKDGANIDVMIGPATSMWNVRR